MIKGIIFDLDGTLIDSMNIWCNIDRAFLKENGVDNPPSDVSDKVKKLTIESAAEYFINNFGLKCSVKYIVDRIEELVRIEYEENISLKPYVNEVLDMLDRKNIPYGIATATYKSLAEAVLKRLGIYGRFKFLLTESEYPRGKNFPDIYMGGAERLGFSPNEILVVEDSLHCIETALKAGFVTVGIYDEVSASERDIIERISDYYFESLDKIESIL
ncbi:MAG: HAD family phosphatase [Ruminococcus sp.]|nr:HAD family phosphatase [Ruminococcus sp.]MDE6848853.1 HAD family phosphatase [Ruminococcus sp.]MDE7138418.1 HAD family phosphatase [Ruminococcus sp.]